MADRLLFRSGGVTVELDDIGSTLTRRLIERAAPGLLDKIREATERVRRGAEAEWPVGRRDKNYLAHNREKVGKPHSRDQFRSETVVEEAGYRNWHVTGRIWNDAVDKQGRSYWQYIRPMKLRRGSAIVVYVRKPLERERDRLREELPQLLPEALRG